MGSDPEKLYSFDDFLDGMKSCGIFAYLPTPNILLISIATPDDIGDLKNLTSETETPIVSEMCESFEQEFKTRLTDVLVDLNRLGYFRDLTN